MLRAKRSHRSVDRLSRAAAAAEAVSPKARSPVGKAALGVSSVKLGMSALRLGSGILKRYPVAGTAVIAGVLIALASPTVRRHLLERFDSSHPT